MKLLVTGGAGFIGSCFVKLFLEKHPGDAIVTFDSLTYAGNIKNLDAVVDHPEHTFVRGDICDAKAVDTAMKGADAVVHFAAESHVDRSIESSSVFLQTNVVGTGVLLDAARRHGINKFVHVSTDEVYGSRETGFFTETDPLEPNSPYSASKAASDLLALAYHTTHGLPVTVTRCTNNYGPYQFPEKLIPLFITNAMTDQPLPIYGDGLYMRDWIYVEDHCDAVDVVLQRGRPGEIYNIAGGNEKKNMEITDAILSALGKPETLKRFVEDRPGHDRRYAIAASKLEAETGWRPKTGFAQGLQATIEWYKANREWWADIKSGRYMAFYERLYAKRLQNASATGA